MLGRGGCTQPGWESRGVTPNPAPPSPFLEGEFSPLALASPGVAGGRRRGCHPPCCWHPGSRRGRGRSRGKAPQGRAGVPTCQRLFRTPRDPLSGVGGVAAPVSFGLVPSGSSRWRGDHRIHRMVGVGRDLCGSPSPTPSSAAGLVLALFYIILVDYHLIFILLILYYRKRFICILSKVR